MWFGLICLCATFPGVSAPRSHMSNAKKTNLKVTGFTVEFCEPDLCSSVMFPLRWGRVKRNVFGQRTARFPSRVRTSHFPALPGEGCHSPTSRVPYKHLPIPPCPRSTKCPPSPSLAQPPSPLGVTPSILTETLASLVLLHMSIHANGYPILLPLVGSVPWSSVSTVREILLTRM